MTETVYCTNPNASGRRHEAKRPVYVDGQPWCRRCLNRQAQDRRLQDYVDNAAPRCPDHPQRRPRVSRWNASRTPVLTCTAPLATEPGQGRHRGRPAVSRWCDWTHPVPDTVIKGTRACPKSSPAPKEPPASPPSETPPAKATSPSATAGST